MKTHCNKKKLLLFLLPLACYVTAYSQMSIPTTGTATENFNSIGTTAPSILPANWKMSSAGTGLTSGWTTGTNATDANLAASTGSPITGGRYNWATSAGTDWAIGFMTSSGYASPNAIMAYYRNTTGSPITSLTITFQVERYRINTGSFFLNFFSSTDGSSWTARTDGDLSAAVFAPGTNSYSFATPQTVYKIVTLNGLSIANNGDFYLKWVFNTPGSTNSQGLGLDNVSVSVNGTPSVSATLSDALTTDNNANIKANEGDRLTYTATVQAKNGAASNVQYNAALDANTTLHGAVKTSALAIDDSYNTAYNTVLSGENVLSNDFGLPAIAVLAFGSTETPTVTPAGNAGTTDNGGTVTVNTNGSFTYTPPLGFVGYDRFAYQASTGVSLDNDVAVVTIAVGALPSAGAPEAFPGVIGNVQVNNAASLLSNDAGTGILVGAVNGNPASVGNAVTTTNGGSVTINQNGSFTYTPARGYEGPDQFSYTIDNAFSTPQTVTVDLTVTGMMWFISNGGPAGDGRLGSPYNSIAAFQAVNNGTGNNPAGGDFIFLYENAAAYDGTINLLSNQKLIGQDATATLASITGYTVPAFSAALPVTNSGNADKVVLTTTAANTNAINLNSAGVSGTNLIRGLVIGSTTGTGINGSGFGALTLAEVSKNGTGGALTLTNGAFAAGATIDNITTSSSVNAVSLSTITGALTISGGAISGATGSACNISGGSVSVTYSGGITQANNAALLSVAGGHTGTLTFSTGTLSATNGTGLQFDNADGTYNFNGTTTLNGGDAGIDILNGSDGTFNFANGQGTASITNPINEVIRINASSVTVNYGGTFAKSNVGQGLSFTNNTGTKTITLNGTGTKSLSTQTANAINISGNSAGTAINFSGNNLTLTTTTGIGFNATGGGIVTLTGTGNTINSTSATALNITNTTIGASGLRFESVSAGTSAGGPTKGIVLNNTGNGPFTITGIGTTIGSGGTIQDAAAGNTMVRGIEMINAQNVSLSNMNITNACRVNGAVSDGTSGGNENTDENGAIHLQTISNVSFTNVKINGSVQHGINGNTVTNLDLTNCTVQNSGNAVWESGIYLFQLKGTPAMSTTNVFSNLSINATGQFNVFIRNNNATNAASGQMDRLEITNSTFQSGGVSVLGDLITISNRNTANFQTIVSSCTFAGTVGQTTDCIQSDAGDASRQDVQISSSTFSGGSQTAINISGSGTSQMTFNVSNNPNISGTVGSGINVIANNSSSATGSINNNTNITSTVSNNNGVGIWLQSEVNGNITATVSGNTVTNYAFGMSVRSKDAGNGTANVTISNNNISSGGSFSLFGLWVSSGGGGVAGETHSVCLNLSNNNIRAALVGDMDYFFEQWSGNAFQIQGLNVTGTNAASVAGYVKTKDTKGSSTKVDVEGGNTVNYTAGTCNLPL